VHSSGRRVVLQRWHKETPPLLGRRSLVDSSPCLALLQWQPFVARAIEATAAAPKHWRAAGFTAAAGLAEPDELENATRLICSNEPGRSSECAVTERGASRSRRNSLRRLLLARRSERDRGTAEDATALSVRLVVVR
jgi:hypothetical protein